MSPPLKKLEQARAGPNGEVLQATKVSRRVINGLFGYSVLSDFAVWLCVWEVLHVVCRLHCG